MSGYLAIETLTSPIEGRVRPPGSKSQTIRSLMTAALASGTSRLVDPLDSDDTRFARGALRELGVQIDDSGDSWVVAGTGGRLLPGGEPLDAGASGLTARALIAIAPLLDGSTTIIGRDRLPERPMGGLVEALRAMGIAVTDTNGRLPVTVRGTGVLPGGQVEVASQETTQFLTGLLIAAPLASEPTTLTPVGLTGARGYVEMTLQTMGQFGATVSEAGPSLRVEPTGYSAANVDVEPDASAAVYPMVAAAIRGGRVIIDGLGSGSLQPDLEIARVLEAMGCVVLRATDSITVEADQGPLAPIDVDLSGCPDGALAVAVACLFAGSPSRLHGLEALRFKESDRLTALVTEIERLGAAAKLDGDGLIVIPSPLHGARIDTYGDHRIAMSFALVGLVLPGIEISNPTVVEKTWPGYWRMLQDLARK